MTGPSGPGCTAELVFTRTRNGRTVLRIARVRAPLAFTRPFVAIDDPAVAEAWLQSTNGGLHAGDDVSVRIVVEEGATARVAPQSATVVLATARGRGARASTELIVEERACLEWTPPATVLVPGSQLDADTHVIAAPGATVTVVDVYVQHAPVPGPGAASARLTAEMTAVVGGRVAVVDRLAADGAWGVTAHGSVWSVAPESDESDELVEELLRQAFAAGDLPNRAGVGIRLAGSAGAVQLAVRRAVLTIRAAHRSPPPLAGLPMCLPSWNRAAPGPPPRRLRRDLVPRLRSQ